MGKLEKETTQLVKEGDKIRLRLEAMLKQQPSSDNTPYDKAPSNEVLPSISAGAAHATAIEGRTTRGWMVALFIGIHLGVCAVLHWYYRVFLFPRASLVYRLI